MVSEVDCIAEILRSNLELEGELFLSGPIYSGSNSVIYRGDGDAFPFPVAIKKCLSPSNAERSAAEDCALQYAALEKVSKAMSSMKTTRTPRPVAQIEEQAILISEWIEGQSLISLFRNGRVNRPNIEDAVERTGRWLGAFHRSHSLLEAPVDTNWAFGMLDEALGTAPKSFKRRGYIKNGVDILRSLQIRIDDLDLPVSWVHGDFKSDNILLAEDHIACRRSYLRT